MGNMQAKRRRFTDWDVSHFSSTATCIQLHASVWRLRSVVGEGQMGSSLLISYLLPVMAAGSSLGATGLQCHGVTSCPWRALLFSFTKTNGFALHRNHFPMLVPRAIFSSEELTMPLKDQQIAVQGLETATGQTAASLKRLPARTAH